MTEPATQNYDPRSPLRSKKVVGATVGSVASVFGVPAGIEALPPDAPWWQVAILVVIPSLPVIVQLLAQLAIDVSPAIADAAVKIIAVWKGVSPTAGGPTVD